ncbi:MAG TPA: hypothetical protein VFN52_04725 [Acidiferrobacteraceae bacterium]|nr:hypothetical protein [Acidiferrobacteraceae bacterium]
MGGAIQGVPLTLSGAVSTVAGAAGSSGSSDGTGNLARFQTPRGVTSDGTNLYVADAFNYTIRKIVLATGAVTTLAGLPGSQGSTDGAGAAARFSYPSGVTTDGTDLYVADSGNDTIRAIVLATGVVTTLAGSPGVLGTTDGTGAAATFNYPMGITTDGTNLYVADTHSETIRKIVLATGAVSTLAGTANAAGSADGIGPAARFDTPVGITTDGTNLYVCDVANDTIRKIVIATGAVTTLAGTAGVTGSADGTGPAALFNAPLGVTTDGTNLYVTDGINDTVRKIVIATAAVTTVAGTAGTQGSVDGTGNAAQFWAPYGISSDGMALYLADENNDTIREIR